MTKQPLSVKACFDQALEIASPAERQAYLDQLCAEAPEVRDKVDGLLKAYEDAGSFLEVSPRSPVATVDEPLTERPGTVIGPYKLMEQIGEGGMGLVFVAEQQHPVRRKVALKVIKPGLDSKPVIARFEAERQALALMDHPNIAKVHDGGTTAEGRPYFVMELVRGIPITEFCDQHRLTLAQRLGLFGDVCRAVQHAHQKGIIHRDLKPSNILVTMHDVTPVVKVIDFGIAKATGLQLTDKTLYTGFAQLVGTPQYMSPEQASLSGLDVDTRTDVYSLGVLLYELLTGTTPFDRETLKKAGYDEMRRIIREEEPPKPSTRISTLEKATLSTVCERRGAEPKKLGQQVRGELDWIVMRALEKDRNRRYESASAFAADVQRYLGDEPVQACPPSAGYRLKKFARRNKAGLVTTGLVAAALVLGTAVSVWQAVEATAARGVASQRLASEQQAHQDAVEQGQRAQAHFKKALEAVQRMLTQVADEKVAAIPQMKEIRQRLIEDAVAFYTDLIALNPRDAQAYFERGKVYWQIMNKGDQAEADFLKAIELDPDNGEFHWALVDLLLWGPSKSSPLAQQRRLFHAKRAVELQPTPATHDKLAEVYLRAGQTKAAVAEYKRGAELAPGSARAYKSLARADEIVGNYRSALANLQKAVEIAPSATWGYVELSKAHLTLGEREQALAVVNKGLGLGAIPSEDAAELYSIRAEVYASQKKHALALLDWNKRFQLDSTRGVGWYLYKRRALAHFHLGHYEQALADIAKAVELQPDDTSNLVWNPEDLVASCPNEGFRKGILALADKTIGLLSGKPPSEHGPLADAYAARAALHAALEHPDQARADFAKAIAIGPDSFNVWYRYALFSLSTGDQSAYRAACAAMLQQFGKSETWDGANATAWTCTLAPKAVADYAAVLELAKKAVELAPTVRGCRNTLGVAQYRAGNWKEAIECLKKSMDLGGGGDSSDWFFLAMACWQLDEKEQARKYYDSAVQWMEKQRPDDKELRLFRAEAAGQLGVKEPKN
jgi:serine/threonine protein kinase/Flp pilus assembly protein TadD